MRGLTRLIPAVLCAGLFLAGCEKKVTAENYEKITVGMRLDEVERFMGRGEEQKISGTSIGAGGEVGGSGSNSQRTYVWHEDPGNEISVTVVDDKIISKGKHGF